MRWHLNSYSYILRSKSVCFSWLIESYAPANVAKPKGSSEAYTGLSNNTCATLLSAQTGPDLVLAAPAYFTLAKNQSTFSRNELVNEMRAAPGFFKETYISNLYAFLPVPRDQWQQCFVVKDWEVELNDPRPSN